MTRDQKVVAVGAASGVLTMLGALVALSLLLTGLPPEALPGERLAYAAGWIAIAALPLFLMLLFVGNARFTSDAIDPTLGKETDAIKINGRVAENTLQQYVLFVVASLALAACATGERVSVVAAAAIIFVVMRFAFWIGYRIHPLYRAFGMAGTSYLNVVLFGYAIWLSMA